jgi:hypothetical protein
VAHLKAAARVLEESPGPYGERISGTDASDYFFTDLEMACRTDFPTGETSVEADTGNLSTNPFRQFALESRCAELAGRLMQSNHACFFYDQFFHQSRVQDSPTRSPWHQDIPYWQVEGTQVASVWVALDACEEARSVQFLAGSHLWGEVVQPTHFATNLPYETSQKDAMLLPDDIARRIEDEGMELLSWGVEPGDCIVFSALAVHGQQPAEQEGELGSGGGSEGAPDRARAPDDRPFRRIATRWTGDDARYRMRDGEAKDVIPSPFFSCSLAPGDPMPCARFPIVWQR